MANYHHEYFGGGYSLDQDYGNFIGYRIKAGQLGFPMRPDTANQIAQVSTALNQGIKPVEVGVLGMDVFHKMPKDQFKEIARLAKVTGAEPTMHAPLIEASGYDQEGRRWSEDNKRIAEEQLKDVVDKSHEMDVTGNIPITMHSSNLLGHGSQFTPGNVEEGEDRFKLKQQNIVNRETGEIVSSLKDDERYDLGNLKLDKEGKPKTREYPIEAQLDSVNVSHWRNKVEELTQSKKISDELLGRNEIVLGNILQAEDEGVGLNEIPVSQTEHQALNELQKTNVLLDKVDLSVHSMFEEAVKYAQGNPQTMQKLKEISKYWEEETKKNFEQAREEGLIVGSGDKQRLNPVKSTTWQLGQIHLKKRLIDQTLATFGEIVSGSDQKGNKLEVPQVFVPIEEFVMDKSADTFANVALHSYSKYGKKAPIISIENLYPDAVFANPNDFKALIDKTKEEFMKKAVNSGMSKSEAKKAAEQTIGVTWDVGHLNVLKKHGFTDKDVVDATKLIGKDVKHVHLTDNFGYSDSHLAPGMGNVPIKEHLEALEKAGTLKDVKMINEAPEVVIQFGQSPHPYTLSSLGAHTGMEDVPYWNNVVGSYGNYFGGYGTINPSIHHSLYGRGFTQLPQELGGVAPGDQGSRATGGTPLA